MGWKISFRASYHAIPALPWDTTLYIHHRRSIRLRDYDYCSTGAYFVTICAFQRECLFGEVVNGEMQVNPFGEIVREEWQKTDIVIENVTLDEFVIMPNHIHGILIHMPFFALLVVTT